ARFLPLLPGAGHGSLQRRTGTQSVRDPRPARTVGGKRCRTREADRIARDKRQGRSHAAAVSLSPGRALERHRQHRRRGEFHVRHRGAPQRRSKDHAELEMKRRDFLMTTLAAGALGGTATAKGHDPGDNVPCVQGPDSTTPPTEQASALFPGFESRKIPTTGATINVRRGGSGPPLLLLHGYPQTHAEWHQTVHHI